LRGAKGAAPGGRAHRPLRLRPAGGPRDGYNPKGPMDDRGPGRAAVRFETQTRNEQNQVRASLERLCERLAEW